MHAISSFAILAYYFCISIFFPWKKLQNFKFSHGQPTQQKKVLYNPTDKAKA